MSLSGKVNHSFGSVQLQYHVPSVQGSTSSVDAVYTPAPTGLTDAAATLTVAQIQTGVLTMTPTAARTVTLPTAALMADALTDVGQCYDFNVIDLAGATYAVTVAAGSGGTTVGTMAVSAATSGKFRIRMTNVTSGTEAYNVYRLV